MHFWVWQIAKSYYMYGGVDGEACAFCFCGFLLLPFIMKTKSKNCMHIWCSSPIRSRLNPLPSLHPLLLQFGCNFWLKHNFSIGHKWHARALNVHCSAFESLQVFVCVCCAALLCLIKTSCKLWRNISASSTFVRIAFAQRVFHFKKCNRLGCYFSFLFFFSPTFPTKCL